MVAAACFDSPSVVISQPMFFPWVGMLEQVRLADIFVHYDDVQFSKGSFTNRVQLKTAKGTKWLTLPLANVKLGVSIKDLAVSDKDDWRRSHLDLLPQSYEHAPYAKDMLELVRHVYAARTESALELIVASFDALVEYFNLGAGRAFAFSSGLGVPGRSTQRVLDTVAFFGGRRYITGHGARHYLEHERFEARGVSVEYVDYQLRPYPQLHGAFTPYVSALDLVANVGRRGALVMVSGTVPWREFVR